MARSPLYAAVLALAVSCGLAFSGCANVKGATAQTDAATDRFHKLFDSGQFDAIYAAADSDFQKTGTAQPLVACTD